MSSFWPIMENLTLKDLAALNALLSYKSISAAAEEFGCAQPNMSRCVSKLRHYFQDPLLVRCGNTMKLTPKAVELKSKLDELQVVLKSIQPDCFDPYDKPIEFVIAAPDFVVQNVLVDVMAMIHKNRYKAIFDFVSWNTSSKKQLLKGNIHLAVSVDNNFPDNIYRRIIDRDRLVCVASKEHPISQKTELKAQDLLDYPHVLVRTGGGWIERIKEFSGVEKNLVYELAVGSYSSAFAIIEKTEFITIVPLHVVCHTPGTENLNICELPFPQQKLEYCFWWHERFHQDPAHKWLSVKCHNIDY